MLRNIKSYNQADILEWSLDLENLPNEIANKSRDILSEQEKLATINANLQAHLKGKVNPTRADIESLQARLYVIELPAVIEQLQKNYYACEAKLKELRPLHALQIDFIKPINDRLNKLAQAIKILDYQDEIIQHRDEIERCQRNIQDIDVEMTRQQSELKAATQQRTTAESMLTGLQLRLPGLRTELAAVIRRDEANSQYSSSAGDQAGGYSSTVQGSNQYSSSQSQQTASQYSSSAGGDGRGEYTAISTEQQNLRKQIAELEGEVRDVERHVKDYKHHEHEHGQELHRLSGVRDSAFQRKNSLQLEIRDDEKSIENCYRAIGNQNWAMNRPDLQQLIRNSVSEREPYLREQARLKVEIDGQEAEISRLQNLWANNSELLKRSRLLQGAYASDNNVAGLARLIETQKLALSGFVSEQKQIEQEIQKQEAVIRSKSNERLAFETRLSAQRGKKFLFDLRGEPLTLLKLMRERLTRNIREYEKSHQAGQSLSVRACLAKLQDKIDFIFTNNDVQVSGDTHIARLKYYQLSGLIHHEIGRLDNAELQASLQGAFAAEMVDAQEALVAYQELQNSYLAVLHDFTPDDVNNEDLRLYVAARDDFQQTLDLLPADATKQWKNLKYYCSRSLKDAEQHRLAAVKAGDDSFDHKFQTNLIHALSAVYATPKEQAARDALHNLSAHIPYGNPSRGRKIAGIILMVLGAAAAIAGLAVGFFSIGMLSPVSIGCMAGGATLFAIGSGLLINGRQKDQAKSVANVEKAASHPKLTSSLFPRVDMLAVPGGSGHPDASAPGADLLDMNLN